MNIVLGLVLCAIVGVVIYVIYGVALYRRTMREAKISCTEMRRLDAELTARVNREMCESHSRMVLSGIEEEL